MSSEGIRGLYIDSGQGLAINFFPLYHNRPLQRQSAYSAYSRASPKEPLSHRIQSSLMSSNQDRTIPATSNRSSARDHRDPQLIVPTLQVDLPEVTLGDFTMCSQVISNMWELTQDYDNLRENHRTLQRAFQDQLARNDRLEQDLQSAFNSASPFVLFVQGRYDLLRQQYKAVTMESAEYRSAFADRHDKSSELDALRTQLNTEKLNRQADNVHFLQEISQLSDQLQVNTSRALEDLRRRHRLAKDRYRQDRSKLQDRIQALTTQLDDTNSKLADAIITLGDLSSRADALKTQDDQLRKAQDLNQSLRDQVGQMQVVVAQLTQERDRAMEDRDSLRDHITGAATTSFLADSVPRGETQVGSVPRRPKRRRSRSPSFSRSPRYRPSSPPSVAFSPADSLDGLRSQIAHDLQNDRPQTARSPTLGSGESRSSPSPEFAGRLSDTQSFSSESSDEITRCALSGSRSTARRNANRNVNAKTSDTRHTQALSSPSGDEDQDRRSENDVSSADDSQGSVVSIPDLPRGYSNALLPPAVYGSLPSTQVPWDQWIPGYRSRDRHASLAIAPWSSARIARISIAEMDAELLFRHFSKPRNFLFPSGPGPRRVPRNGLWSPNLITMDQIDSLYDQTPWDVLDVSIPPISFPLSGWYAEMALRYQELENRHLMALWEATHLLPLYKKHRDSDPRLDVYWNQRKQRRSRLGASWKRFLQFVLRGLIAGHCDLDILLDPFFLHYPRSHESGRWYPGLGTTQDPADLVTALQLVDEADPWRNQFRSAIADHPGSSIDRLVGKFDTPVI